MYVESFSPDPMFLLAESLSLIYTRLCLLLLLFAAITPPSQFMQKRRETSQNMLMQQERLSDIFAGYYLIFPWLNWKVEQILEEQYLFH